VLLRSPKGEFVESGPHASILNSMIALRWALVNFNMVRLTCYTKSGTILGEQEVIIQHRHACECRNEMHIGNIPPLVDGHHYTDVVLLYCMAEGVMRT
jgi:hypothetical protein